MTRKRYFAFDDEKGWGRSLAKSSMGEFQLFRDVNDVPDKVDGIFYRMQQRHLRRDRDAVYALDRKTRQMVVRPFEANLKDDKKAQLDLLSEYMPRTRFLTSAEDAHEELTGIDLPIISKSVHGSGSRNVRLLHDARAAKAEIEEAFGSGNYGRGGNVKQTGYLLWQDFLKGNDGDWRVIVIAKKFAFILRRYNRNDVPFASGSGRFEPVKNLDSMHIDMLELCLHIAEAHDFSMCGIDVVFANRKPFLLETASAWTQKAYADCTVYRRDGGSWVNSGLQGRSFFDIIAQCFRDNLFENDQRVDSKLAHGRLELKRSINTPLPDRDLLSVENDFFMRLGSLESVRICATALAAEPQHADLQEFNLALSLRHVRRERRDLPPRVAVCGWELSHNAAGRVRTLADLWRPLAETEIIGATFPRWGNALWAPIRESEIPCHMIHVADEAAFPRQALEHVLAHPYDIVHLSKPRFPNILFGLLYKLIWDAHVILDIDDEELGAVGAETTLALESLLQTHGGHPRWEHLGGKDWTRTAVGLWDIFDGTTVSNPALQARYGGPIIAHARAAAQFSPSPERRRANRARFNIPQDKTVVLFFGTPRRHKGLLETAQAIAALGRDDLCYVVAGDFPDPKLKDELTAIKGADIRFLPDQPYDDIADVVALGDICVLLQRDASLLASYQLPAKMVDALAMGLLVLAQPTPALMGAVKAGAVAEVFPHSLTETLRRWLDDPQAMQSVQAHGRAYFLDHLEAEHSADLLTQILSATPPLPAPGILLHRPEQRRLFEQLGGWHMFGPTASPAPPVLKSIEHTDTPAKTAMADAKPDPASAAAAATQIIVYSALVGDYESLKEPEAIDPSVRYILFTDNPNLRSEKWEVVSLDTLGLSPRRASRLPKLLPHRYLPEHDISVYLDSSLTVIEPNIAKLTKDALRDAEIAAYRHYERSCLYDEIIECVAKGKVSPFAAKEFSDRLRAEGFPDQLGLLENAFLVRRNTKQIRALNEAWHKEFSSGPGRDQFHLMYLLWKRGIPWRSIENAPQFRKSPHLRFKAHTGAASPALYIGETKPRINWVIGGPSSKGWAYENNARRLMSHMPEFEHVINDPAPSDCAIYFDVLIQKEYPKPSKTSILRLGGPNPLRRLYGDDAEAIATGLSNFDTIVPLSRELQIMAELSSATIYPIPNGLDLMHFRPKNEIPLQNGFTVGFAGNCVTKAEREFKGLDILEEAATRVGVKLKTLQKGRNQIPHDRMVEDFYHQIDCLVHPVAPGKEGCSNVIMEALSCGVPVITTRDCGFHGTMLIDGANVLFCERSVESIAEHILKLKNNPTLGKRLRDASVRFSHNNHDITAIANKFRRAIIETVSDDVDIPRVRPRLRIAMLTTTFWPKFAGMEMMVHNLATALHKIGNSVVLFTRTVEENYTEIEHDYDLVRTQMEPSALRESFAIRHRETPFDAIYVQGAYAAASLAHDLKKEFGIPLILRTHGEDIQIDPEIGYGLRLDTKKNKIIQENMKRANVNVSISRHVLNEARPLALLTDHRCISNGVDANHFSRARSNLLHEHFKLPAGTRILLTVGRNVAKKSFPLAIEALSKLRRTDPRVVLVHVGKEGNGEDLRESAIKHGVSDAFFEYGEANYFDMPGIYAAADIFVFPSRVETFGNVTIEAMAAGLPCVEFDYGANRDKIIHGRTGFIVPYADTDGMANAISQLLNDPELHRKFSSGSKNLVRKRFDWTAIAKQYHDAFLEHSLLRFPPAQRMKLAFAADKMVRIKGGGGEKSLTSLVNAMAMRGHEVFLLIKEPGIESHELPFYSLHPDVKICNILGWTNSERAPSGVRKDKLFERTVKQITPDAVIGFFLPEFGFIARGVQNVDVPLMLSHRNDPKEKLQNTAERYPKRLPEIDFANLRAQVITVQMQPYIGLLPEIAKPKAVVVPNSVLPVPDALKAKPEVLSDRNVILNVARLASAKNQGLLIAAFSRISEKYPDWDVHIYGDGPLQEDTSALISSLGLSGRVFLKGTTQNIMPAYQNAKIFAFPSLYEGFSRALSEAMMHGLPAVVIKDCICSNVFIGDSKGGVITSNNVDKYADGLEELIASPDERRSKGKKARDYISQFSPDLIDDLWEEQILRTCSLSSTVDFVGKGQ